MRPSWLMMLPLVACTGEEGKEGDTADTGEEDTAGGGGELDNWSASGTGDAYFADGEEDNSLFTLAMSRATEPREGEAYYGFVSAADGVLVPVGEIGVNGEDVDHSFDIGENAIIAGYSHFEAWANATGEAGEGDAVWLGDVDPTIFTVIQEMLIASSATPDGQGSLRALESHTEFLVEQAAGAASAGLTDEEVGSLCEMIGNALEDPAVDSDDDGDVETFTNVMAVQGTDDGYGYVELIFDDLGEANDVVDPNDPIHANIEQAYDGVQFTEFWAERAASDAHRGASVGGDSALRRLEDVAEQLSWTLVGNDIDEDGVLEYDTEGGLDYSVDQVSQMAQLPIEAAR
ncbi:MAG: hypothetical protein FJ090_21020 [Deltaproteobacteria bacterium]|nr:hypothetical protein [Deltaproteobacteria bacterium]